MLPSNAVSHDRSGAASLASPSREEARSSPILCEGWILKKRRKKMQGFARRYLILYSDGMLKYSFGPGKPIRDQLSLLRAAISTTPGRKDIHVDSDVATFHIRCLTTGDFDSWMAIFRKFIRTEADARRSASVRLATQQGFLPASKISSIVDDMGSTIAQLEESISLIAQEHLGKVGNKRLDKHKDHSRDGVLALFKKGEPLSIKDSDLAKKIVASHATPGEMSDHSRGTDLDGLPSSIQNAKSGLQELRAQHESLLKLMQHNARPEPIYSVWNSSLPATAEARSIASPFASSALRHSRQNSLATVTSGSLNEWYDAPDGPEEFITHTDEPEPLDHTASFDYSGQSAGDSGVDTDVDDCLSEHGNGSCEEQVPPQSVSGVVRRVELPATPPADEGSLFTILKNNVGKDLSTIAFPVTFNEPLTLLQRAAEEIEYYDLLDKAAQSNDPVMRMCYVAAFAVSGYAHTRHRSGRKGFNPMLGETFEDTRMGFIAEKVRHNPVEIAFHAEGNGWQLTATSCGKTKFWGKSLEIIPLGITRVQIGHSNYVWRRPSSFVRNLVVGTKYLEHCGKMTVEDTSEQTRAVLEFKQNGYWGASHVVSGAVYGNNGNVICQLDGKWDEQLSRSLNSSQFCVLWRMNPFLKNTHQYYGFTSFAMSLNEITGDLVGQLPPTDSRYRPDVRALEEGDIQLAEEEKQRIEECQRQRRRQGEDIKPRWFRQVGDEWEYTGKYWESRKIGWRSGGIDPLW